MSRGQDDRAAKSIRRTRGITDEARIAGEIADIKNTWLAEQELHSGVHLRDMIRGPDLRRTLISLGAAVGQTATGITFISGYSVYFYVQARIGAPFTWVMVGLALTLTANVSIPFRKTGGIEARVFLLAPFFNNTVC
jgi:hypothetical protein